MGVSLIRQNGTTQIAGAHLSRETDVAIGAAGQLPHGLTRVFRKAIEDRMNKITIEERAIRHYRDSPPNVQYRESCQLIKLLVEEIQRLKAHTQGADLKAAAIAVVEMECNRINEQMYEPYDPIANPGQFDPRIVALAKIVWQA